MNPDHESRPCQYHMHDDEEIKVDLKTGKIERKKTSEAIQGEPFASVQMEIYQRGGLLS